MRSSFRIAEISYGRSRWDKSFEFEIEGTRFEVLRMGANFSLETVKAIIHSLRNEVDAFALTSLPPVIKLNGKSYVHRQYLEIMKMPCSVPLCDGSGLREISNINSLVQMIAEQNIEPEKGVFFPAAILSVEIEEFLRSQYGRNIYFGDAYSLLGLPLMLQPFPGLMTMAQMTLNIANFKDLKSNTPLAESNFEKHGRASLTKQVEGIQSICCDLPFLLLFDSSLEFVRGKDVITWSHHPQMEKELNRYSPRRLISLFPEEYRYSPSINYSILDAALRLKHNRQTALTIEEWEKLLAPATEIRQLARKFVYTKEKSFQAKVSHTWNFVKSEFSREPAPDFAFVIHALSHKDFSHLPVVGPWIEKMPKAWNNNFDRLMSHSPPLVWGHVRHVQSLATGREVNGIVYVLTSTPKILRESPVSESYAKIEKICHDAAARGAKIIGLGAYTKVIGDSGLTINANSPIPVTTGNSLSASATLWGLYDVVTKMKLLNVNPATGKVRGQVMVIGATGSIGSVSAKLLAMVFEKIYLVAPRLERLNYLVKELKGLAPGCEIVITSDANEFARDVDVLVTATSAFDQKIVDVMLLKPGCVVCDCSRPLDFSVEDAKKRPDILILESGEVNLPGPVEIDFDLQLPGKTVYACLGETALLALEERYEPFTVGRDIDWVKVKEIYKMARKHGVMLSAIQGHMGLVSDREIALTRELALSRRKSR
jgi:predicted amino acid dehydrogenase